MVVEMEEGGGPSGKGGGGIITKGTAAVGPATVIFVG